MAANNRYVLLDGVRGTAALAVMFYHISMRLDLGLFRSGAPAVDLFFALSGFVLAKSYANRLAAGMTVGQFMLLRFVRLQPLVFVGVAIGSVKMIGQIITGDNAALSPIAFGVSAVLNGVMLPSPVGAQGTFPLNAALWSLFAELVVNAAFVLWIFAAPTRQLLAVGGIAFAILAGFTWRDAHLPTGDWAYLPGAIARATFGFVLGVVFARMNLPSRRPSRLVSWSILAAVLAVTFPAISLEWKAAYDLFAVLCLIGLLLFAVHWEAKGILVPISKALGELSYPIYVVHYPLLGIGWAIAERLHGSAWIFCAVYVPAVVLISWLLVRYYDPKVRASMSAWLRIRQPAPAQQRR